MTGDRIVAFLRGWEYPFCPSIKDVKEGCSLASNSVASYWLRKLREQGIVDWVDGDARTLHLVERGPIRGSARYYSQDPTPCPRCAGTQTAVDRQGWFCDDCKHGWVP